jgi:hypothetical protein
MVILLVRTEELAAWEEALVSECTDLVEAEL